MVRDKYSRGKYAPAPGSFVVQQTAWRPDVILEKSKLALVANVSFFWKLDYLVRQVRDPYVISFGQVSQKFSLLKLGHLGDIFFSVNFLTLSGLYFFPLNKDFRYFFNFNIHRYIPSRKSMSFLSQNETRYISCLKYVREPGQFSYRGVSSLAYNWKQPCLKISPGRRLYKFRAANLDNKSALPYFVFLTASNQFGYKIVGAYLVSIGTTFWNVLLGFFFWNAERVLFFCERGLEFSGIFAYGNLANTLVRRLEFVEFLVFNGSFVNWWKFSELFVLYFSYSRRFNFLRWWQLDREGLYEYFFFHPEFYYLYKLPVFLYAYLAAYKHWYVRFRKPEFDEMDHPIRLWYEWSLLWYYAREELPVRELTGIDDFLSKNPSGLPRHLYILYLVVLVKMNLYDFGFLSVKKLCRPFEGRRKLNMRSGIWRRRGFFRKRRKVEAIKLKDIRAEESDVTLFIDPVLEDDELKPYLAPEIWLYESEAIEEIAGISVVSFFTSHLFGFCISIWKILVLLWDFFLDLLFVISGIVFGWNLVELDPRLIFVTWGGYLNWNSEALLILKFFEGVIFEPRSFFFQKSKFEFPYGLSFFARRVDLRRCLEPFFLVFRQKWLRCVHETVVAETKLEIEVFVYYYNYNNIQRPLFLFMSLCWIILKIFGRFSFWSVGVLLFREFYGSFNGVARFFFFDFYLKFGELFKSGGLFYLRQLAFLFYWLDGLFNILVTVSFFTTETIRVFFFLLCEKSRKFVFGFFFSLIRILKAYAFFCREFIEVFFYDILFFAYFFLVYFVGGLVEFFFFFGFCVNFFWRFRKRRFLKTQYLDLFGQIFSSGSRVFILVWNTACAIFSHFFLTWIHDFFFLVINFFFVQRKLSFSFIVRFPLDVFWVVFFVCEDFFVSGIMRVFFFPFVQKRFVLNYLFSSSMMDDIIAYFVLQFRFVYFWLSTLIFFLKFLVSLFSGKTVGKFLFKEFWFLGWGFLCSVFFYLFLVFSCWFFELVVLMLVFFWVILVMYFFGYQEKLYGRKSWKKRETGSIHYTFFLLLNFWVRIAVQFVFFLKTTFLLNLCLFIYFLIDKFTFVRHNIVFRGFACYFCWWFFFFAGRGASFFNFLFSSSARSLSFVSLCLLNVRAFLNIRLVQFFCGILANFLSLDKEWLLMTKDRAVSISLFLRFWSLIDVLWVYKIFVSINYGFFGWIFDLMVDSAAGRRWHDSFLMAHLTKSTVFKKGFFLDPVYMVGEGGGFFQGLASVFFRVTELGSYSFLLFIFLQRLGLSFDQFSAWFRQSRFFHNLFLSERLVFLNDFFFDFFWTTFVLSINANLLSVFVDLGTDNKKVERGFGFFVVLAEYFRGRFFFEWFFRIVFLGVVLVLVPFMVFFYCCLSFFFVAFSIFYHCYIRLYRFVKLCLTYLYFFFFYCFFSFFVVCVVLNCF